MARKRKRINWPFRWACFSLVAAILLYICVQSAAAGQTFAQRGSGVDWGLAIMASLLDTTIAIWFVSFGACIGSFLNVVAYRLPLGRGIGGHSSCPYCCTPIDSLDNVPVLGWIKLRARCRACRLPISIQYPLVEFTVATVFFVVYVSEFASGGHNLPIDHVGAARSGFMRIAVSAESIMRITSYLFAVSGLIAAALIAVRNQRVPLSLYAWSLAPITLFALISPGILPAQWQGVAADVPNDLRLHALATLLCGAAAGLGIARCVAPVLHPGFDRRLLASDAATRKCRQFLGGMAVVGAICGWQASVGIGITVALAGIFGCLAFRRFGQAYLDDLTVWLWLGLLGFRILWSNLVNLGWVSADRPALWWSAAGLILFAFAVAAFRFVALLVRPIAPKHSEESMPEDMDDLDPEVAAGNS